MPYRRPVERWYPELQAVGADLKERGVAFVDLSGIFRDVETTVYGDACCHLSDEGRDLLVDSIASAVAAHPPRVPTAP